MRELDEDEADSILNAFNADIAFEIGCLLREKARTYSEPIAISICSTGGVVYFQCCSKPGVIPDNFEWVKRKRVTVERFHRSSFFLGCKARAQDRTPEQAYRLSERDFAFHGGGFPIRVRGSEGIQGTVVVSGLKQADDHALVTSVLKDWVSRK